MASANPLWGASRVHDELLKSAVNRAASLAKRRFAAPPTPLGLALVILARSIRRAALTCRRFALGARNRAGGRRNERCCREFAPAIMSLIRS
jgi:hypothetical protein